MAFAPAPEYHVFPTQERPLKPYEAVVRATGETRPLVAELAPGRGGRRHPDAGAGAGRRARGRAGGDADPARRPALGAGLPPYSIGARLPRTAARAAAVGRASTRWSSRGLELGRDELNETRAAPGAARRCDACTAGSRRRSRWWRRSRSSSTRAPWPAATARRRAAAVGAAGGGRRSCRRATRRSCSWRPRRRRTPSSGCCAPRCAGLADLPVRVLAAWNRRPLVDPVPCRPTRGWSSGCPTRGRCRAATWSSATAATARSRARWPAAASSSSSPPPAT